MSVSDDAHQDGTDPVRIREEPTVAFENSSLYTTTGDVAGEGDTAVAVTAESSSSKPFSSSAVAGGGGIYSEKIVTDVQPNQTPFLFPVVPLVPSALVSPVDAALLTSPTLIPTASVGVMMPPSSTTATEPPHSSRSRRRSTASISGPPAELSNNNAARRRSSFGLLSSSSSRRSSVTNGSGGMRRPPLHSPSSDTDEDQSGVNTSQQQQQASPSTSKYHFLMLSAALDVAALFAPTTQVDSRGRRISYTTGRVPMPPLDRALLVDMRPESLIQANLAYARSLRRLGIMSPASDVSLRLSPGAGHSHPLLGPPSGSPPGTAGSNSATDPLATSGSMTDGLFAGIGDPALDGGGFYRNSTATVDAADLGSSLVSQTGSQQQDAKGVSPRTSLLQSSSKTHTEFWEPQPGTTDPFEDDVFSPDTKRKFAEDKSREAELDGWLAAPRQALLKRQATLSRPIDRRMMFVNVRFLTAVNMWQSIVAAMRYCRRAHEAFAEEMYTQELIKQLAPLCAIRLRQRLKRTKVEQALATMMTSTTTTMTTTSIRPSIEVLKAERTFSHFPEEQLAKLRAPERMELRCFLKNECLVYRGCREDCCFIVERGICETREGFSVLSVFRRNQVIGALGMITGEPRLHSVMAATETLVWVITRAHFEASLDLSDSKTRNALQVVHELRQKNIRDVYHRALQPPSLRQFLLFAGIRDTVLENAVSDAMPRVFRKGDVMLRGGDVARHAILVIHGRVRLSVVAQHPLTKERSIPQHVASVACLHRPKRRTNPVTSRAGAGTDTCAIPADVIMRDDSSNTTTTSTDSAGSDPNAAASGNTGDPSASSPLTSVAATLLPSPLVVSVSDPSGLHANGMACDINCSALLDVPALVAAGDDVINRNGAPEGEARGGGDATEGGGVCSVGGDALSAPAVPASRHAFTVTALSDSVDCLVFSDRLRLNLFLDRETRRTFQYNMTCLALPFIKPLARHQLLQTIFPKCFAFDFMPVVPVETLVQYPVVFAADDVVTLRRDDPDAMAIVVLKGDVAGCTHMEKPYLWPEIPFLCLPMASTQRTTTTTVVAPIEGVLLKVQDIAALLDALRSADRKLLFEAMEARLAARVGRHVPNLVSAPTAPQHEAANAVSATSSKGTVSGDQRIKLALYGSVDETDSFRDSEAALLAKSRMNPLYRAEMQMANSKAPRRPDMQTSLSVAMEKKLAKMEGHPSSLHSMHVPTTASTPPSAATTTSAEVGADDTTHSVPHSSFDSTGGVPLLTRIEPPPLETMARAAALMGTTGCVVPRRQAAGFRRGRHRLAALSKSSVAALQWSGTHVKIVQPSDTSPSVEVNLLCEFDKGETTPSSSPPSSLVLTEEEAKLLHAGVVFLSRDEQDEVFEMAASVHSESKKQQRPATTTTPKSVDPSHDASDPSANDTSSFSQRRVPHSMSTEAGRLLANEENKELSTAAVCLAAGGSPLQSLLVQHMFMDHGGVGNTATGPPPCDTSTATTALPVWAPASLRTVERLTSTATSTTIAGMPQVPTKATIFAAVATTPRPAPVGGLLDTSNPRTRRQRELLAELHSMRPKMPYDHNGHHHHDRSLSQSSRTSGGPPPATSAPVSASTAARSLLQRQFEQSLLKDFDRTLKSVSNPLQQQSQRTRPHR